MYFQPHKFGQPIPASPHAVCVSIPTMEDLIAYEEKRPEALEILQQGYPRFIRHHYIRRMGQCMAERAGRNGWQVVPVVDKLAAQALAGTFPDERVEVREENAFWTVWMPPDEGNAARTHSWLQHTGALISSRRAEDWLVAEDRLDAPFGEETGDEDDIAHVRSELAWALGVEKQRDVHLGVSGMNVFYNAFREAAEIQAQRRRRIWILIGWLYLDTQRVLDEIFADNYQCIKCLNPADLTEVEELFARRGQEIAGVITEVPTNPLIQTANIPHVSELCREAGAICILDPTTACPANVHVMPYADIVTCSLTKYAGHAGDVLMGAVACNRSSPFFQELDDRLAARLARPYQRDLQRLAWQMRDWRQAVQKINANTTELVQWLEDNLWINRVHWTGSEDTRDAYEAVRRPEGGPGGLLSVVLNKPLSPFYDRARMVKGPSFGVDFTLMCPFMYLAHYSLVSGSEGRHYLRAHGIEPDLIRISCGTEPFAEIASVLEEALA